MTAAGAPRSWTLNRRFGEPFNVEGPDTRGPIEVIEAEPLLNLLERAMREIGTDAEGDAPAISHEIAAFLRAHGVQEMSVLAEPTEARTVLAELVRWINTDLDLSDDWTLGNAEPDEHISCTRSKECWERGRAVIEKARAVLTDPPVETERPSIKRICAMAIRRDDLIIEAERPLARVVHRKVERDVLVWRDGDGENPWDVLPQDKQITIYRPGTSCISGRGNGE